MFVGVHRAGIYANSHCQSFVIFGALKEKAKFIRIVRLEPESKKQITIIIVLYCFLEVVTQERVKPKD